MGSDLCTKNKKTGFLKALFIIAGRAEYFTADLTPYFIGVFLGMSVTRLNGNFATINLHSIITFIEGLLIVILAHYSAVHINVLADYEMDKRFKSELTQAVDIIGHTRLALFVVFSIVIGFLICLHLSYSNGLILLVVLWGIGTIFAVIYSAKPVRLKKYPFLGDVGRGVPLVITMPFGYYLFTQTYHHIITFCVVGMAINLFGLFMVGETWDWKDDKGIANTIAVTFGYKVALFIGLIFIPAGVAIWTYGFYTVAATSKAMSIYILISLVILAVIMVDYILRVMFRMNRYEEIEAHCGIITKVGTTVLWLLELAGAIVLFNVI
ncbi:4-hydroxybenzoate polyprenyltransferase [Ruminiclostridium sufflavum DSM 19573]|uniref:4-hydroxybenzoate polyprenyltransferase n=1 Tax=Ruminiclostridium sufflavum DSM 19573 TaxID=1121337 RepID=A0A318XMP9_9FIRM|nr:UbiA family prenyltransferase [Ruminiclostridium sufflavum]PYG88026.1 4-hydroxybenzoate polyprenyltransferase [Ruminiclostridium sufflavum DSM 19573]